MSGTSTRAVGRWPAWKRRSAIWSGVGDAEWALFLPVDMPFLPPGLIEALLREWMEAVRGGALVCHISVDGTPQPLVSLLHRRLYPFLREALVGGQFKVTPVLQSACAALACTPTEEITFAGSIVWQTSFMETRSTTIDENWLPTEMEQRTRPLWFVNLNSKEDLLPLEDFSLS